MIAGEPAQRPCMICHPVWSLGPGGLERQLVQLLRRLPADSFRHVVILRRSALDDAPSELRRAGNVRFIQNAGPHPDRAWSRRLAAILRDQAVDVLHLRGLSMLPDGVMAADLYGRAAVAFSFHGFEDAGVMWSPLRRGVYRSAILRCDDRWAVSRAAADALSRELRLPAGCISVIPNGIDANEWASTLERCESRRALGLPVDRPIVLCVGNLRPVKGQDVLLKALARMGPSAGQATILFVGQDHQQGRWQTWAGRNLREVDVRFLGPQSDVRPWYQAADLFVLPSRWEGHSNALLEAMACGLPVIATAAGGNAEMIDDGKTGLLVPPDDPDRLARAMEHLLVRPARRAELAAAARREVRRRFDAAVTTAAYARRYTSLAARAASMSAVRPGSRLR